MSSFPVTLMSIAKIRTDGGTQSRVKLDESVIEEYAEAMENKAKFPPIVVFSDNIDHWLAHGFHRIAAAEKAGLTRIEAEIRPGSLADAQWYSFGVNKTHGLRRTNEDKRKAVEGALEHEKGSGRTDTAIAEHCGVGHDLVRTVRASLEAGCRIGKVTKRVGKDGKEYNVEKIQEAQTKKLAKVTTSETTTTKEVHEYPVEAEVVEEQGALMRAYVLEEREPEPEVVKDGLGNPIPDALLPAFRLLPETFNKMRNHLIEVRKLWSGLERLLEDHHPWVRANNDYGSVSSHVNDLPGLIRSLSQDAPYTPCVYCHATAPDFAHHCQGCKGAGWMSLRSYESAPTNKKAA